MSNETPGGRSPFNKWWAASGILLALVVVALVMVLFLGRGEGDAEGTSPSASPTPTDASSPSAPASPVGVVGCDLDDSNQDIPTVGPAAEWEASQYLLVPRSDTYGPDGQVGERWGCYAKSPTGALFAAANLIDGIAGADYAEFVEDAALETATRDAWVANENPAAHQQEPGRVAQFAGFQYVSVEPSSVILLLALQDSEVVGSLRIGLSWSDSSNTWLMNFDTSDLDVEEAELDVFTPWSASNGG
jgi:hypothetical protein